MTILRWAILLVFATTATPSQLAHKSNPKEAAKEPGEMVRSLYNEVVARDPTGIPKDADMKSFSPYLSQSLLHRIDLAGACAEDWNRQHPDPNLKPPLAWLEFGLFSGAMENADPQGFHVIATETEKNGSFRVIVGLWIIYGTPQKPEPSVWYVAPIVVRENGKFVVNDVIFLKGYWTSDPEFRLSSVLASGCKGPRWVGYKRRH